MNKYTLIASLAGIIILLTACKGNEEPYIKIKDEAGNVYANNTIIAISPNSTKKIFVESGYINKKNENNRIYYRMQVNGKPEAEGGQDLFFFPSILDITKIGAYNNLETENATITLNFNDYDLELEGTVRIAVQDTKSMQRIITFKIE